MAGVGPANGPLSDDLSNLNNEVQTWASLSLTHVEYPAGDWLGKILAYISLSPLVVLVSFGTLIIFRRDLHTITFLCGTILSEGINFILKHVIKEARPYKARDNYTEYGMPSSHSQLMWFVATYLAFFVLIRLHHGSSSSSWPWENLWKHAVIVCWFLLAGVVSYSRVYLQYHTWAQVCWGALIGSLLACLWFSVTQFVLTPLFPRVVSWPVSELLMLRDTTLIPNVMWFEYTSYRAESRTRQRKLVSMKSQ
ncbi:dolichyldiphosphatase 1 [Ixodes scapularis]|uniref:Dolichyldiphosphatase n=2 Tax=Ixodes TaxID=6944 RepID=B7PT13_IXOSC|nr:dolichyldiphosphatase 1 [Ixodes scapularis]EEC09735.1 dolichyl pyrophosphate phosphatase, putative [Ixodes scapularis]|eukprot:XP_002403556.1 dolichyl pyrophosphate phosphatase, putative [Ixodes scapularis]